MLDRGRTFTRHLLSVFEKLDGERSYCPRCEGSGLFHSQKSWLWNRTTNSNSSCWFCEGVGVMPLYGLRGFLLGRASAAFRTEDLNKPVDSPIKLHLCLGKYPGTRCKLRSFKPSGRMQELLYNRSETPSWLIDAAVELASTNAVVYNDEDINLIVAASGGGPESSERISVQAPMISPLDPFGPPYPYSENIEKNMVNLAGGPPQFSTKSWKAPTERGQTGITASRVQNGRISVPFADHVTASMLRSNEISADKSPVPRTQREEANRDFGKRSSESMRTRLARRNQIRIKAEQESIQRAMWIQRLKPLSPESTPNNQSGPLWSLSSSWKELSSNWLAEETDLARQSARASQIEAQEMPNLPSGNRVLFARLVDKLPFFPNFLNPHKW